MTVGFATTSAPTRTADDSVDFNFDLNNKLRVAAESTPAVAGPGAGATATRVVNSTDDVMLGALTETAPASDTASSGLNGRLQRLAQRLTSLITAVGTQVYGAGTAAAAQRVTKASDSPDIALLGAVNETAPASDTASSGQNGRLQRIAQRLTSLLVQGTGVVTSALRTVPADDSGPTTTARLLSAAASTNSTNVKNGAGVLYGIKGVNVAASAKYLKLYNKATAPTVGTDTPVMTIGLPAVSVGGGFFEYRWPAGRYFATGIGFGITGAAADADTTALTAGDVVALNVDYR